MNQQLQLLRSKMSKEIILANRNGNINQCKRGLKDVDFRESYCNGAFVEDFVRNSECKSNEEFCFTCCEYEFGSNFVSQRDICYDMCDKKPKSPGFIKFPSVNGKAIIQVNQDLKPGEGHWVWAPKEETGSSKFE